MNRNQPMRQYANPNGSGTVTSSMGRKDPIDNVADRVMMIAQRLVAAENTIKNQSANINKLNETIDKLEKKIENIALKASGKEFKKPETTTRRKTTTPATTDS